ncbi:CopD family protein [Phaeobacter sp.]|uniref:CopD family protein n=1 Tax=Phaeobacter sp. TaxID=1902409 RepID=UPI0025E88BEA|nr:CopD family protein [Phaeobacter sp.]
MNLSDLLFDLYPYAKSLHIMAVMSWMAGLFYLPRLFVYHVEQAQSVPDSLPIFITMEEKLLRVIMRPAMVVSWLAGGVMVLTPGLVDWGSLWPWSKGLSVIAMTWFHHWLLARHKEFAAGNNTRTGRNYRIMNEVPTILMVVIVVSVIFKF